MTLGPRTPYAPQPGGRLTDQEIETLLHTAEGLGNAGTAAAMFLTINTAKTHLRALFVKLGANDRSHAVALGFQRGYLWIGADGDIHSGRSGRLLQRVA